MNSRLAGLLILAIGLVGAKLFVLNVFHAIHRGDPEIEIGVLRVIFVPPLIGMGLYFMLAGDKAEDGSGGLSPAGAIVFLLMLGVGVLIRSRMHHQLDAAGYGVPVVRESVTLQMPLEVRFTPDAIEITDSRRKQRRVAWAALDKVEMLGVPRDNKGSSWQLYWGFQESDGITTSLPVEAVEESAMLAQVGEHAGPVGRPQPVEDVRKAVAQMQSRGWALTETNTVWERLTVVPLPQAQAH